MEFMHIQTSPSICMEGMGEIETLKDGTTVLKKWYTLQLALIPDDKIPLIDKSNLPNSSFYGEDAK